MYKLVLAEFPYIDRPYKKKRPVLLLTERAYGRYHLVVVAYVTSRKEEETTGEVVLRSSDKSGLTKDSTVKLYKLAAIPLSAIRGELGQTDQQENQEIKKKLQEILGL